MSSWERQRRMATVQLVCYVVEVIYIMELYDASNYVNKSLRNISSHNANVRNELMEQLSANEKCRGVRMSPFAFALLCDTLRESSHLKDNKNSIIEGQVAKFLYLLAHNMENRTMSFFFRRSGETISRQFHEVL